MKMFYTSDTHFGAQRTLELSDRPFKNVSEMDSKIISNWNEVVTNEDRVMHLGDFGDYKNIKFLNGKVSLICGNYEMKDIKESFNGNKKKFKLYLLDLGFEEVFFGDVSVSSKKLGNFYACHEPHKCKIGQFNLFGHIHNLCMVKTFGLNVGTDCHHFYPINEDQVLLRKKGIEEFYDDEVFM